MNEDERLTYLAGKVATNYLVMKNVFGHLSSSKQLRRCSEVNQFWKSILEPMNIWYYKIKLIDAEISVESPEKKGKNDQVIAVTKAYSHNDKVIHSSSHSYASAAEYLQNLNHGCEVRLEGKCQLEEIFLDKYGQSLTKDYPIFLSETRRIVPGLRIPLNLSVSNMSRKLARDFPNLKHLDLSMSTLSPEDDVDAYALFPEDQLLENLRTITIGSFRCNHTCIVRLLKAAPNLTAIHEFPVILVEALVVTGQVRLVKSLSYYNDSADNLQNSSLSFKSALRTLSQLKPELSTFDSVTQNGSDPEILSSFFSIIESSHATLTHMRLQSSPTPINFHQVPPMTALKSITFKDGLSLAPRRYFPEGTSLHRLFPSLTHLTIEKRSIDRNFSRSFRWNGQWAWQIKSITLHASWNLSHVMQILHIFPNIISLELSAPHSSVELKNALSEIATCWPNIENISVCLHSSLAGRACDGACSIDSALTGISDEVLNRIKNSSSKLNHISVSEIQTLEESSTIRKLSYLKSLKISVHPDRVTNEPLSLSKLSHQFGSQFLPGFKLIIATEDCQGQWISDLKAELEPCKILEILISKNKKNYY